MTGPAPGRDAAIDPIDLLRRLVEIDSVNPDLVPGGAGEAAAAAFCASWLAAHGFDVRILEERPGRPSVVGVLAGFGGGRSIMLNGHIDTVSTATYDGDPLAPRVVGDRLHGRGAYDMKSGVAAMLVAAARATDGGRLAGDVVVACVADEEYASHGTEEVLRHIRTDAAVVTEPSDLALNVAHKGFAWFEVEVRGVGAHGSRPDLGIDAIAKAGHLLVAIDELATRLASEPGHPLLGPGSVHASLIAGGDEASTYPRSCRITVERRTIPGETHAGVTAELQGLADRLTADHRGVGCTVMPGLWREPYAAGPGSPIVEAVSRAVERRTGRPADHRGAAFWTDCALLADAGIDAVLVGATGEGAHAAEEWIDIPSVLALADILTATIVDIAG